MFPGFLLPWRCPNSKPGKVSGEVRPGGIYWEGLDRVQP
jgi:hypothetical protein